jgi:hypothetical protein
LKNLRPTWEASGLAPPLKRAGFVLLGLCGEMRWGRVDSTSERIVENVVTWWRQDGPCALAYATGTVYWSYMQRVAISQLRDGDTVDQSFVLVSKQLGQTNTNKLFLKAGVWGCDGAGSLPAVEYVAGDL